MTATDTILHEARLLSCAYPANILTSPQISFWKMNQNKIHLDCRKG